MIFINARLRSLSKLGWGMWYMTIDCTSQCSCSVEMNNSFLSSSSLLTSQPKRQYPAFIVNINYNILQSEVTEKYLQAHISFSIQYCVAYRYIPVAAAFGQLPLAHFASPFPCAHLLLWNSGRCPLRRSFGIRMEVVQVFVCLSLSYLSPLVNCQLQSIKTSEKGIQIC